MMDLEDYTNVRIVAEMSGEAYATLMGIVLTALVRDPATPGELAVLDSITWTRAQ
jgi:hypothetical protein